MFVQCFATVVDFILMFRHSLAHLDLLLFHGDLARPDSFIVIDGTSLYDELVRHLTKLEQLNLRVETVCAFAGHMDSVIRSFQTGEGWDLFSTSMNLLSFIQNIGHPCWSDATMMKSATCMSSFLYLMHFMIVLPSPLASYTHDSTRLAIDWSISSRCFSPRFVG